MKGGGGGHSGRKKRAPVNFALMPDTQNTKRDPSLLRILKILTGRVARQCAAPEWHRCDAAPPATGETVAAVSTE